MRIPDNEQRNFHLGQDQNDNWELTINPKNFQPPAREEIINHQLSHGGKDMFFGDGTSYPAELLRFIDTLPTEHKAPVINGIMNTMNRSDQLTIAQPRGPLYILRGITVNEAKIVVGEQEKWPGVGIVVFSLDQHNTPQSATYQPNVFKRHGMQHARKRLIAAMTGKEKTVAIREVM